MPEDTNPTTPINPTTPVEPVIPVPDAVPEVPAVHEHEVAAPPVVPEMQPGEAEAPAPAAQ